MSVYRSIETGSTRNVVSTIIRRISAYTRQDRVARFKIGITCNPEVRFRRAYAAYYDEMIVLYQSSSINNVSELECELITHNRELADNIIAGGGGGIGYAPYYLYLVIKY